VEVGEAGVEGEPIDRGAWTQGVAPSVPVERMAMAAREMTPKARPITPTPSCSEREGA
jgi:hypothetical protein